MAKKANVFTEDLLRLFDELSNLNYAAALNQYMTRRSIAAGEKSLRKRQFSSVGSQETFFLGTRLAVPDYYRASPYVYHYAYEARSACDNELHELAGEVEERFYAQIICAAFELMEQFFCSIGAKILFQTRSNSGHGLNFPFRKAEFHKAVSKWQNRNGSPAQGNKQYFKEYMQRMYREGYAKFLDEVAASLPFFKCNSRNSERLLSLKDYYISIQFFRHQTVHNLGRYDSSKLKQLPKQEQGILKSLTKQSKLFKSDMLLPSCKAAGNVLSAVSGMAYLMYEGLSHDFHMKTEWPKDLGDH